MTGHVTDTIRQATETDCEALVELYRDAYGRLERRGFPTFAADADRAMVESWLDWTELLVRIDEDELLGAVQIRTATNDGVPQIARTAVASGATGSGLGSELISTAEDRVRERGYDRARLETFTGHPFLSEMYCSRGYQPVGVDLVETRPYDVLRMRKRLRENPAVA